MDRVILHCDCNNFFASVESVLHPEFKTVPMAVAGDPSQRHGIILAKNELAKAAGVQTAEPVWQAQRKCPGLLLVPPHHGRYEDFSRRINEIYQSYTDLVEPFSIDESWLDVTGSQRLFGDGKSIADQIRRTVRHQIGVTVSVGVSFNKIFAKLGSDYKKPDATTVISRKDVARIVHPLPVGDLFGVGRRVQAELARLGIRTIGQLAAADRDLLIRRFGKAGLTLSVYARGEDDSPVNPERAPIKSVGNGTTYPKDLVMRSEIYHHILLLSDRVAGRLRHEGKKGFTVQISVRDPMLSTVQRQKKLDQPTWLAKEIAAVAMGLLDQYWKVGSAPIRALTVSVSDLTDASDGPIQYSLLPTEAASRSEQQEKVEAAMEQLRRRYGKSVISFGKSGEDFDSE